jgi:hypothetical protein
LIKTDGNGNKQWEKTYGGTQYDLGYSIIQTSKGDYLIAGSTMSFGNQNGDHDIWLIKIDSNGDKLWDKTFGGMGADIGHSVIQDSDGGYVISGSISTNAWLIKTDDNGNKLWDKTFGSQEAVDSGNSVIRASDGSYVITGYAYSYGTGQSDIWLTKVVGDAQVNKTFGLDGGNSTYNQAASSLQAMRFRNTARSGTLIKLELLIADTTPNGKVRLGVYIDNNGKPGKRLIDAGGVTIANGWVSANSLNLAVAEGNYYWLVFNLQSANGIRYQSGQASGSHFYVNGVKYGALPSSFPSAGARTNANQYVMRATVQ